MLYIIIYMYIYIYVCVFIYLHTIYYLDVYWSVCVRLSAILYPTSHDIPTVQVDAAGSLPGSQGAAQTGSPESAETAPLGAAAFPRAGEGLSMIHPRIHPRAGV